MDGKGRKGTYDFFSHDAWGAASGQGMAQGAAAPPP